eukprot:5022338-Prymnesium_polylepis.2
MRADPAGAMSRMLVWRAPAWPEEGCENVSAQVSRCLATRIPSVAKVFTPPPARPPLAGRPRRPAHRPPAARRARATNDAPTAP